MSARARVIFRLLLRLLPAPFRREFGAELEDVLEARLRGARGATTRAWIWLITLADVLTSAVAERTRTLRTRRPRAGPRSGVLDRVALDVRFALRSFRRQPGFTAVAVSTLALGIGATLAIFSVVLAVLIRPLPYPHAERIVAVETLWTNSGRSSPDVSGPDFRDWQAQSDVFEAVAAYNGGDNLGNDFPTVVDDRAVFANARFVTADFFAVFGQRAAAGRLLGEHDVTSADPTVAVVAHQWATMHFGSVQAAVGRQVSAYGMPLQIVGVAAPGFRYPDAADLWLPSPADDPDRGHQTYRVVGKLRAGVELAGARAQLRALGDNLARRYPENRFKTATLLPLQERITVDVQAMLWVLIGAVALVLLIACANVSNMLLVRGTARTREVALRAALGAGRGRLVRQLLTEGWVLAGSAMLAGTLFALVLIRVLVGLAPADLPRLDEVRIDGVVLLVAFGLSGITTVLFALVPALHALRLDLSHALTQGASRGATSAGSRTRSALVVAEVALSVILLTAAGLLLRSFQVLQHTELGFTTERVLVAYTEYSVGEGREELRIRSGFYADLLDRLREVPGVSAAAGAAYLPMGREPRAPRDYFIRGRPEGRPGERPQAELYAVTPDYFRTLEIPLLGGRDFEARDAWLPGATFVASAPVAIINETLARAAFTGDSPLGQHIRTSSSGPWMQVVGLVGDTRWQDPRVAPPPMIFVPSTQDWGNSLSVLARTSLDESALAATLRALLHDADPTVPVRFETMEALFAEALARPRFRTRLIGAFAAVALLLAAMGIFSVLAFLVSQRTREIAVRRAVGARTADIIPLVVAPGLRSVAIGLILGLAGALSVARMIEGLLHEVSPWDARTYAGTLGVLTLAALLAMLLAAARAARISPLRALQSE